MRFLISWRQYALFECNLTPSAEISPYQRFLITQHASPAPFGQAGGGFRCKPAVSVPTCPMAYCLQTHSVGRAGFGWQVWAKVVVWTRQSCICIMRVCALQQQHLLSFVDFVCSMFQFLGNRGFKDSYSFSISLNDTLLDVQPIKTTY